MSRKPTNTNLGNVVRFEIIRNLKKPTFWIAALILPFLLIGYIALASFTGQSAEQAAGQDTDMSTLKLGLYDASGYLSTDAIDTYSDTKNKIEILESKEQGIAAVKDNDLNVFYHLPPDFNEVFSAEIYAKADSTSIFSNYEGPLRLLLTITATDHVEPIDFAIISNAIEFSTTNFTVDNTEVDLTAQLSQMIIPGIGLALFYILVVMFGNRLTTAMVEEKENRISEMILTSLNPKDLIIGKIISLIALGFIQLAVLLIPIIVLATFGFSNNLIPIDFTIDFSFWTIFSTLVLLLSSFFLFTSLCVAISTLVPTAKDAGQFAGVIMILVILPLFFIASFMSPDSTNAMTYFLSYFPPSAPISLMFRHVFGTLPIHEFFIGLAVIAISSFLVIKLSVFIYSRTAIEFTSRVNLRKLLSSPRKNWK